MFDKTGSLVAHPDESFVLKNIGKDLSYEKRIITEGEGLIEHTEKGKKKLKITTNIPRNNSPQKPHKLKSIEIFFLAPIKKHEISQ